MSARSDHKPAGYEKGTAAWDISQILTVHHCSRAGAEADCKRVASLIDTRGRPADERLRLALAVPCTCGAEETIGVPSMERTSLQRGASSVA